MGSGSSKSSSSRVRRDRSGKKDRIFQLSCLGTRPGPRPDGDIVHQVYEPHGKDGDDYTHRVNQNNAKSGQSKTVSNRKREVDSQNGTASISPINELVDWDQSRLSGTVSRSGRSSIRASISQSLNTSSSFFSHLRFNPGNVSFRLNRATSLGSSRSYRDAPVNIMRLNDEENPHFCGGTSSGFSNSSESQQGGHSLHSSLVNRDTIRSKEDMVDNRWLNTPTSEQSYTLGVNLTNSSSQNVQRGLDHSRAAVDTNYLTSRLFSEPEYVESEPSYSRHVGAQEPVERNIRFSRTLSVGRLRDRVLHRSSLSESTYCPNENDREASDEGQLTNRLTTRNDTATASFAPSSGYSQSGQSSGLFSIQDHDSDTSQPREARYHNLLEHRAEFLDRQRRIQSQVRALQRLESRFESLSGHCRSCILFGQHRTGHCTCRNGHHDPNSSDDTNARASISRIVMLAEALFEVMDEIHQQSVVLSSQPSISSIGSVPAPNEVVDSLCTKLYARLATQKNEDVAQCYICLVEYDEGDSIRILPCRHEFHRICVDKWLKEIHRVCPLCRQDICRSDSFSGDSKA
ncbi:hypothetical protein SAY87_012055 [Trapa incisa]|uniref:RING-type domain-containing protein n=1 Tax=Trapa incisa TaxID=236973 RepID=A0AAN7GRP2_9MYRT|nr:hypothetical protein SAY87_012055 [Trapa incisa]